MFHLCTQREASKTSKHLIKKVLNNVWKCIMIKNVQQKDFESAPRTPTVSSRDPSLLECSIGLALCCDQRLSGLSQWDTK